MPEIPRDKPFDSTLAVMAEGYNYIGNRCRRFNSDIFEARLLGRRIYCMRGESAARMFYVPERFTRNGALPKATLKLLQDEGSVATLDGEAHHRRKAMFMSLMSPERLDNIAQLAADGLRGRARLWRERGSVVLHQEFREILLRAICAWAGVPLDDRQARRLTHETSAMIDNAAWLGPTNWYARWLRRGSERFLRRLIEDVRAGKVAAPEESAAHVIATHRDTDGKLLDPDVCAVEMLNVIRPTVAVARFMTFAALALHEHPESRDRLGSDDSYLTAFVQEVRRLYPFFGIITGIAREPFEWQGFRFDKGTQFVLDLHGTDHDERIWEDPNSFRPERFLTWNENPFTFIPQGGGDHYVNHRCAGEWLTIEVMKAMLRTLARDIDYDVPPQDLTISLTQFPSLPKSGFRIANVRLKY